MEFSGQAMNAAMWNLSGKRALITGASGGLGAHFAKVLAIAGAEVLLAARREAALDTVARDIKSTGGQCTTVKLDVADSSSIRALSNKIEQLDILVNSAGITREGAVLDQSEADWDDVINTNLKGMFLMAQTVAKTMRDNKRGGSIINIASILGLRQTSGVLPYAVSKAGTIQLTKTLALELAKFGIRVNTIAPGYFQTEINTAFWQSEAGAAMVRRIPQRRLGELENLDGPLLLLASDAGAYMTGSILTVDGGHLVNTL